MPTYGTDPEYFSVVETENESKIISPALLQLESGVSQIGGNIKHPIYIDEKEFSWMGDGAAWEVTFKKPFTNAKEMHQSILNSLDSLEEFLFNLSWNGMRLKLLKKPVAKLDPKDYLDLLDNEFIYWGFIFGCDKDKDAIIENYQCKTIDVKTHKLRYGGGHWHIGVENIELAHMAIIPYIQLQAILLGNISLARSENIELERIRFETYGTPGRYRPQKWGTEYRFPSNSWTENLETIELMIQGSEKAYDLLNNPEKAKPVLKDYLPQTIESISQLDQDRCLSIFEEVLNV